LETNKAKHTHTHLTITKTIQQSDILFPKQGSNTTAPKSYNTNKIEEGKQQSENNKAE